MRTNIRPFLRFAAFFLVLALAVALANTCLIQTDTFVALMMDELKNSRDIELAVVGSSIVRDHFNAALISEQTGRKAFSAAVPGLSLQGELALTRELYRQNSPEYTVLVVEPYNFNTAKEDPNAFFKPKNDIVFDAKLEISRNMTNGIVVKIPSCPLSTPNSPEICVNIKGSVVMGDRIINPIKRTLAAKIAPVDATFLLLILTLLSKT